MGMDQQDVNDSLDPKALKLIEVRHNQKLDLELVRFGMFIASGVSIASFAIVLTTDGSSEVAKLACTWIGAVVGACTGLLRRPS
jgi:hypothetical protein